jgi:hypothetical protein
MWVPQSWLLIVTVEFSAVLATGVIVSADAAACGAAVGAPGWDWTALSRPTPGPRPRPPPISADVNGAAAR